MNSARFHRIFATVVLLTCLLSCNKEESSFFDLIPSNAMVMVESNSPSALLNSLEGKSYTDVFVTNEESVARLRDVLVAIDTILNDYPKLKNELKESPSCLAWIPNDGKCNLLWISKMSSSNFRNVLKQHFDSLYVFSEEKFLCISDDANMHSLVKHQLLESLTFNRSDDFIRLQKTLGAHVDAHLFFHDENGWMALDVLPKDESLTLNGYALAADSLSSYKPLKYQLPVKNSVVNILPYNTSLMIHYGMSDYVSWNLTNFTTALSPDGDVTDPQKNFETINAQFSVDVEKQLLENVAEVSLNLVGDNHKPVFVARMTDPAVVTKFMGRISAQKEISSQTCQGYSVNNLGSSDFIPTVFGPNFSSLNRLCYSIVDQYLVVANETKTIQDLIACYRSGRTLDLSENFKNFQKNMLESSNVTIYSAGAGNQLLLSQFLDEKVGSYLISHSRFLDRFSFASLQLASSKDLVYVNLCLSQATEAVQEDNVLWKVNLEAPLASTPVLFRASQMSYVVVFDQNNTLYLIDENGKLQWKRNFEEAPMGPLSVVKTDVGNILLFNTIHTIQGLDLRGDDAANFPISLPFESSNGLALFDYNENHDYRILVCGTDRMVYNYTLEGKEAEGWNHHRSDELVSRPLQHITGDGKDYLIVSEVNGGVRILDRQGRTRIPLASDLQKSTTSDIYENITNRSKGLFLTSDNHGKLLYIAADGALARTDFGDFSEHHYFFYDDFNNDQIMDFIYLDGRDLRIFDRFKNVLFAHHFDVDITTKPSFYQVSRSKRLLGLVSENAHTIYLIDHNGSMIVNAGLVGDSYFTVGSLRRDDGICLITGVGNALFNYVVE